MTDRLPSCDGQPAGVGDVVQRHQPALAAILGDLGQRLLQPARIADTGQPAKPLHRQRAIRSGRALRDRVRPSPGPRGARVGWELVAGGASPPGGRA
jgi:hypothetical protein